MRRFSTFSLQQKITALILAASCIVLFLSSTIFFGSQLITNKRLTIGELDAVADIIGNNVTAALVFDDKESAEETLAALRAKPGIVSARIYRTDGTIFAEYVAEAPADGSAEGQAGDRREGRAAAGLALGSKGYDFDIFGGYVDLSAPIRLDGEVIGTLFITSDLRQMYSIIDAYLVLAGLVILFLIVIAFFIAARLQKIVSEPVLHLLDTMQSVAVNQDYSVRASKFGTDELGELAEGFNAMLGKIQSHDRDLRAAWQEADAASRSKSEFLANMSHELRTPLNAIIGFSEVIKGELLGPLGTDRYRYYAQDIFESGHHLLEVISDILDISKVEAGEFELQEEETDVRALIDQSVRLVRDRAEAANLALVVDIEANLPHLRLDQRLIKQSLINLLSNAVKFSRNDDRITVRAATGSDGWLILSVTDTGIGIAEADIAKILQPFSQVESAFSRSHEGTGLGLPLAKSFVEAHGGVLEIRSTLGEGTAVAMRFPPERVIRLRDRISTPFSQTAGR
ncbi:MAG: ATP-binding protein [Kiloniellaceae bacterium]